MKKALTPLQAKTDLKAAIRKNLGLRNNAKIDVEESFTNSCKTYKMLLPGEPHNAVGFTTYYFPGCCKYGIVSGLFTNGTMRRMKLSPHVLDWAVAQISGEGYSKVVGTTSNSSNSNMEAVLKKLGWKRIDRGINSNTDNVVSMWIQSTGKTSKKNTFMSCDS